MTTKRHLTSGFTIIELGVVIVIIGVLATLTLVAYGGIQDNARKAALMSDLDNSVSVLELDLKRNGNYPATVALTDNGNGLPASSGTTYQYALNNTNTPKTFCLTATKGTQSYNITQDDNPLPGICPILYFDAGVSTSYSGAGTTLTDLSGHGNNGTLMNGVGYDSANSGALIFDGANDYISAQNFLSQTPANQAWTVSATVKLVSTAPSGTQQLVNFNNGVNLSQGSTNKLLLYLNSGANDYYDYGNFNLKDNLWHIVSFVFQNSTGKREIYVDGVDVSTTGPNLTSTPSGLLGTLTIGTLVSGKIGDFRVYDKALSATEEKQNFDALRSRYGI